MVTIAAWAATYLTWPFSNDQGNLAWVGHVLRSGGMPYRDAWDVKGPAAHLLFALEQALFGRNEWGLRLFDLMTLAACAMALRRIVRQYAGPVAARWTIALYLLWYASLDHHNTAQPDAWAAVLVSLAAMLALGEFYRPWAASAGAGGLVAVCALIKPTYVVFLVLPVIATVARLRTHGRARVAGSLTGLALGFVLPIGLCLAWFVHRGALGDWIAVQTRWIPASYTDIDAAWLNRVQVLVVFLTAQQFAPAVPLAVSGLVVVRRSARADAWVLLAWAALAMVGVLVQGHFFTYHWLPLFPPLAALAGIGMETLWRCVRADTVSESSSESSRAPLRVMTAALLAVVLVGAAMSPGMHLYRFAKSMLQGDFTTTDQVEFGPFGHHGGVFPELATYLRLHTSRDESVLLWGSAAGINYLTHRDAVGAFGFVQPLVDPPDTELRQQYRTTFLTRLTTRPPRYVVALNAHTCARHPSPAERRLMGRAEALMRCLDDIPDVSRFVSERYTLDRAMGPLELWRRR